LNILDFDGAFTGGAVKNAAWVYESDLYTLKSKGVSTKEEDVIVNPEVLRMLHHIFTLGVKTMGSHLLMISKPTFVSSAELNCNCLRQL
jgi:hypothetical protein